MNNLVFSTRNIDDFISDVANEVVRKLSLLNNSNNNELQDDIININGASMITGLSVPTIYSKVSKREIPFSKPKGSKRLYFSKSELTEFIKTGRVKTAEEVYRDAEISINRKGAKHEK